MALGVKVEDITFVTDETELWLCKDVENRYKINVWFYMFYIT